MLTVPDHILVANLPQLRGEVKRYIGPTEPQFEFYLKLLDELAHVDLTVEASAEPPRVPIVTPARTQSGLD